MTKLTQQNIGNIALLKGIFISVTIVLLGFLSGLLTMNEIKIWYASLNKPSFNPPNFIFGPVWTMLYILMGVSLSIIIAQENSKLRTRSITLFLIQFILNLAWSSLFFNFHLIGSALIEIIAMLLVILLMVLNFYKVNRIAGILQIPYLIWVSFATILNLYIYILN